MGAPRKFPDDLTGMAFGRLMALKQIGRDKSGQLWQVQCVCGAVKTVQRCAIVSGATVSCGCFNLEKTQRQGLANVTHGLSSTRTFGVWRGMKARCADKNDSRYGGRGIVVCERWADSFVDFLADMGEAPDGMSIDRFPNNDGNYEPSNCRWATVEEQANNKRNSRYIAFDGKNMTVAQWADFLDIKPGTLRWRLEKGWSILEAFTGKNV